MLLSKKTWCFNCAQPTWVEGRFKVYGYNPYNKRPAEKFDNCANCGFGKHTIQNQGVTDYLNKDSEPCNFMTNDPRNPCISETKKR